MFAEPVLKGLIPQIAALFLALDPLVPQGLLPALPAQAARRMIKRLIDTLVMTRLVGSFSSSANAIQTESKG